MAKTARESIIGCLLGTAVGDALGLPFEGLSRKRQHRSCPEIAGPCLVGRHGMVSDDTEHTILVAQALIESAGEPEKFERILARSFVHWLLRLPAGIGLATLRATLKLLVGVSHKHSGVCSAGNGPAMRSALIGVCYGHEPERMAALVRASTRLTHTDPRAELGALAVALAAWVAHAEPSRDFACRYLELLEAQIGVQPEGIELIRVARLACDHARRGIPISQFADEIGAGNGVSGYVNQNVPVVLRVWFEYPDDFRAGVSAIVRLGGDTDTTAAILGAIIGARVGEAGVPQEWQDAVCELPQSVPWMIRLGDQLSQAMEADQPQRAAQVPGAFLLLRNVLFTVIVLLHGFRRLLPPY